jgi:hypothetical protein
MPNKLQKKIDGLNPWFYPVTIDNINVVPGIGSTWNAKKLTNRIKYRHKLLVHEVTRRYNFKDKSILDLACNCAYWSAIYAKYGASFVFGVEGRPKVCQQAKLYWDHNKFLPKEKYSFICGNVLDPQVWGIINSYKQFDVTLCAGILYHIPKYRDLLRRITSITREIIIIDTRVGPSTEQPIAEPGDLCFNAIEQTRVKTIPYLPNIIKCLDEANFSCEVLPVTFKSPPGLRDQDDYNEKRRVTILARRKK